MLEEEFYKLVTPEGKQNYMLEGQAKLLLLLCQEVDKLAAAQQLRAVDLPTSPACNCGSVAGIHCDFCAVENTANH